MKTKDFTAIEKRLLPNFPGFAIKGTLMFILPLGETLRAFYWEASAFSKKEFYVNVFFLPLFVPTKHLHFTFGHRVGATKRWSSDEPDFENALRSEMLKEVAFLKSLNTARDVAEALESFTRVTESRYHNPHCYEALAYALVRAGDAPAAMRAIDVLLDNVNANVAWESEIASRARWVREALFTKPDDLQHQLIAWRTDTIQSLGLNSFNSKMDE